ncbi:MAG: hypothetical protein J6B06_07685 [Lachnospiraceae bacterium]|nr:hypothetical protein [Lachnospiraceae bacterium]
MMVILAMLLSGVLTSTFFYKMFYEPTHMERNTALGVMVTEEGRENAETREAIRHYRSMQRGAFLASGSLLFLGIICALFSARMGILLEIFRLLLTWETFFYMYQKYQRKIICLKYENQWLEDTAKHMCYMKAHMNVYRRELFNDLAFVPLFLLPFRAFFYPEAREYLQGNLIHGFIFILPFMILLALLGVYYKGAVNRNLVFFFSCIEAAAMWIFQWKLLFCKVGAVQAFAVYVLLLILGMIMLLPYMRGIITDRELAQREFPERMPSDGEELWLYGYYRNKKDKALWVKKKFGTGISFNHAHPKARLLMALAQAMVYLGTAVLIVMLF